MIKIMGNEIWRSGQKIGWIQDIHIFAHDGKRLGYFEGNHVYDENSHKLAYLEGDFLYSENDRNSKVPLEKISEDIVGGVFMEICKCAIYVLLGG